MYKRQILNPSSGAPGFYVENVFCLPGVPSIMKAMLGSLNNLLVGGEPILSETINLRTVESEIAKSLTESKIIILKLKSEVILFLKLEN